jgi:transcriptional regulator with XRE-family HTH domain
MEVQLTFGEYIRRLRRAKKWNLNKLAEHCGLSYTHLSRLENDSGVPTAESVARLAQALDGDLKAMLTMSDCLPRMILDRISAQEAPGTSSLLRTAGRDGNKDAKLIPGVDHPLLAKLKEIYGLDDSQAGQLALAIEVLVKMKANHSSEVFNSIASFLAQGGTDQ